MFALRKDERKLQYSRSNILGFINTVYFTSDNVPDGIKNANLDKCLNHLTALTVSNLKCHIIYFSRGFHNNQ
jgi:hypothetical protein